jgi:hypothetical protein
VNLPVDSGRRGHDGLCDEKAGATEAAQPDNRRYWEAHLPRLLEAADFSQTTACVQTKKVTDGREVYHSRL